LAIPLPHVPDPLDQRSPPETDRPRRAGTVERTDQPLSGGPTPDQVDKGAPQPKASDLEKGDAFVEGKE
jgi:hypothetical protein